MTSLTVFFWFERGNANGYFPAVLCTICFCFCFFGSRMLQHILHCLPDFPKLYGVHWTIPEFYISHCLFVIIFAASEAMAYIEAQWAQFLIVAIIVIILLIHLVESIYFCDGIVLGYNILRIFSYLEAIIFNIIAIIILFTNNRPGIFSTLLFIVSFPLLALSYSICRSRISHFHRVFIRAFRKKNYIEVDKMNDRLLVSCIGSNLNLISDDFSILDHAIQKHHESFTVIVLYAKFAALTFCSFDKLHHLLVELKKLRNLNFAQQVISTFVEILSLQDEKTHNEQKISEMCSIASTEYLRNLNLFWTEILLGRSERLISLSTAVENKFQTAVCLFTLLGTSRGKINHSFEQFCSVATLKVKDPVFPEDYSFFKLLYEPRYQAVSYKYQEEFLQQKMFKYQPPLRSVHISAFLRKYQKTIHSLKNTIILLPTIISIIFAIICFIYISICYSAINPSWNVFYQLEMTGIQIAGIYASHPILLLSYYDFINMTQLSRALLNNYLFETKMVEMYTDMRQILAKLVEIIPLVLSSFSHYNYNYLLDNLTSTITTVALTSFADPVRKNLTFSQYLSIIPIRFEEQVNMDFPTLVSYFNNSLRITLLVQNSDNYLTTITEFLETFPSNAHSAVQDELNDTAFILEMIMLGFILVFSITTVILVISLFNGYSKLFEPLFLLPKVSISELIEKLSSKPAAESEEQERHHMDSQLAYNLKQLGYERPSQAFHTQRQSRIYFLAIIIFLICVLRIIIIPVIKTLSDDCENVFEGMKSAQIGFSLQITVLKALRDLVELIDRLTGGFTVPEDRNELLMERLFNNIVNMQYLLCNLSIEGISFPNLIDRNFYFTSANDSYQLINNFTFVNKISYLYTQTYIIINNFQATGNLNRDSTQIVLQLMLSAISHQVPDLMNDIFNRADESLQWMIDKCILYTCLMLFISFIFFVFIRFCPVFSIGNGDFAQPLFASIPPRSIHTFHQYLGAENDERNREEDPHLAMSIFNDDSTFQTIIDPLILAGSDGRIVSMSQSALQLFNIDSPPSMSLNDFLQKISSTPLDFQFPLTKPINFKFQMKGDDESSQAILFVNIFPTQKFTTNGNTIFYGCLIEDITRLKILNDQLNYETIRVRILTVHLVPEIGLDTFLNNAPFKSVSIPKITIASFFIPTAAANLDITLLTQEALRDALSSTPSVTFIGRTIQMFRVVSGLTNNKIKDTEAATDIILFAQHFMKNMIKIEQELQIPIDVRCGIHISGPYIVDIVSECPPVLELFGASIMISQQIAANAIPKHICISRDTYEAVFDQGFTISFEKEIKQVGGDEMSIHNVELKSE